ncbi:hypothetical protein TNCV_595341 [Trichonephila clavipes]|nr:hypothetical protein TNCV_595341 [Trichonephila clavipes]
MPNAIYSGVILTKPGRLISGPIVTLKRGIFEEKYRAILSDLVHPMMQTLGRGIFQDDSSPIHVGGLVQS